MIDLTKYGKVTSEYGERTAPTAGATTNHQGIDIVLESDNVPAVVAGIVSASGYNSASGYYVSIRDGSGNTHTYRHLAEKSKLSVGAEVKEGQTIGTQGSTGVSTGKHLHYDVKGSNMEYINPVSFFSSPVGTGSQTMESDSAIVSGVKSALSPVLTVVLCIIIFIGAAFFLMKAFDISIPTKEALIKKGVEIFGN